MFLIIYLECINSEKRFNYLLLLENSIFFVYEIILLDFTGAFQGGTGLTGY